MCFPFHKVFVFNHDRSEVFWIIQYSKNIPFNPVETLLCFSWEFRSKRKPMKGNGDIVVTVAIFCVCCQLWVSSFYIQIKRFFDIFNLKFGVLIFRIVELRIPLFIQLYTPQYRTFWAIFTES